MCNEELQLITGYCVIVEQAQYTLQDVVKIWIDPDMSN